MNSNIIADNTEKDALMKQKTRRQFFTFLSASLAGWFAMMSPVWGFVKGVYAKTKRILLPETVSQDELIHRNPRHLDTRNLKIMPLEEFETMGPTRYPVDLKVWRLKIDGAVTKPLDLSLAEIKAYAAIEREVLLICPGVFANHGRWKGVSIRDLLQAAGMQKATTHITVLGNGEEGSKKQRFSMEELKEDRVFLAYQVNGRPLPEKHGFPVRVVAEDHYGFEWTKYVHTITADTE